CDSKDASGELRGKILSVLPPRAALLFRARARALPCEKFGPQQIIPPALRDTTIQIAEGSRRGANELSPKVGDGGNREGGISWGCLTPPLLHRRSDMPCPTITSSS